ncbi:heme ABC transporter ATP-binding protein [Rariglobus hedericola]|uniref:Heme ABC transporter ATP-binding protein n=1 Tax=Rariglobus hedericola TaxID=2597822 RepID=A0A556QMB6_9BACT|nr:heme ABC transporter ATP-binding protein [Rariglobus hedericola]TSJ77798.1 heme ABC transporter ATP-binding protein [Rariglobus hedericola]
MLRAENIRVIRNGRPILDGVSCEVPAGKVTVILGPNGAGKSTLLRLFAGEYSSDAGQVSLGGRPLSEWRPKDVAKCRAVLPQESSLTFPFRVDEVVLMGRAPHVRGMESAHDHAISMQALQRVDMAGKRERIFPSLSGGEKQRVNLARALAQIWEPVGANELRLTGDAATTGKATRVLLLDEPTSNLDLAHQHSTLREAQRFARDGATVLAILHDLNLALAYADQVILLCDGRIAAAGEIATALTPARIREVFGVECRFMEIAGQGRPFIHVLPMSAETR